MSVSKIIVIDEKYSDNNGAYDVVIMWNGSEVVTEVLRGYADKCSTSEYATKSEVADAVQWHIANVKGKNYIGDTYIVGGSRKVAKGTSVVVVDYADNGYYGVQVQVQDANGVKTWISAGCLKKWVCGSNPFWSNAGIDDFGTENTAADDVETFEVEQEEKEVDNFIFSNKSLSFFMRDKQNDIFEWHRTLEDAKTHAEEMVLECLDGNEWDEHGVDGICYGIAIGEAYLSPSDDASFYEPRFKTKDVVIIPRTEHESLLWLTTPKPIETAPYKEFILIKGDGGWTEGYLRHGCGWVTSAGFTIIDATHWLPLPKTERGDGGFGSTGN